MKKMILSLAFLSLTCYAYAQESGIKFEKGLNWTEVKVKAKAENKLIFLDAYATWCGPCKWMDENAYNTAYAGSFFKDKFICVKVQMDSTKNDIQEVRDWYTEAKKMMVDYKISAFPTLLFFDSNANLVHKFMGGAISDSALVQISTAVLNPKGQYYTLLKQYKDKKLPYSELPNLIKVAIYTGEGSQVGMVASDYIDNYLLKLNQQELMKKDNLLFISANLNQTKSKGFKFFMKERDKINNVLGADKAEYAVRSAIAKEYMPQEGEWLTKKPDFDLLQRQVSAKFGPLGEEMLYGKRMNYYSRTNDWANYGKYYKLYFETAIKRPEWNINAMSWYLFVNVVDTNILKFSCDVVMKYAIEEWYQNDLQAWDTYANLQYKLGRKSDAITWEEKALKAAKGTRNEATFAATLEKMKKGLPTWSTITVN